MSSRRERRVDRAVASIANRRLSMVTTARTVGPKAQRSPEHRGFEEGQPRDERVSRRWSGMMWGQPRLFARHWPRTTCDSELGYTAIAVEARQVHLPLVRGPRRCRRQVHGMTCAARSFVPVVADRGTAVRIGRATRGGRHHPNREGRIGGAAGLSNSNPDVIGQPACNGRLFFGPHT